MTKIRIELTDGRHIDAELFEDKAPKTVANFLSLIQNKFFDGLCFHRVIPGFMIQGGGFVAENGGLKHKQAPGNVIGEFAANGFDNDVKHTPGTLSMARAMDKNSASSQFFICVDYTPHLDGQYAAFGRTLDKQSLDVAIDISKVKTGNWTYYADVPVEPVIIKTVTVLE